MGWESRRRLLVRSIRVSHDTATDEISFARSSAEIQLQ